LMYYESGIEVKLYPNEMLLCRMIGSLRVLSSTNNNFKTSETNVKRGQKSQLEYDIDGVLAEYAFCKHFNVWFNFDVRYVSNSWDAMLLGKRFDIKSTDKPNGGLLDGMKINENIDVYALAFINGDTVTLKGYLPRHKFIKDENIQFVANGNVYLVSEDKLKRFKR